MSLINNIGFYDECNCVPGEIYPDGNKPLWFEGSQINKFIEEYKKVSIELAYGKRLFWGLHIDKKHVLAIHGLEQGIYPCFHCVYKQRKLKNATHNSYSKV